MKSLTDSGRQSPAYFGSWGSKHHLPLLPQEPLSEAEAKQRKAYYMAFYNENRQLVRFQKYLDGNPNWKIEYAYWENGKVKTRLTTDAEGSQQIREFDPVGQ